MSWISVSSTLSSSAEGSTGPASIIIFVRRAIAVRGSNQPSLLVDARDFAGATSQASAMMIWGGLLYLRNWDLLTVWRLCAARDRMIRQIEDWVEVRPFRYLPFPYQWERP